MSTKAKADTLLRVSREGDHLRTNWERFVEVSRSVYEENPEAEELLIRMGESAEIFWNALTQMMLKTPDVDLIVEFIRNRADMLELCAKRLREERINPNASAKDLQRPGGGEIM